MNSISESSDESQSIPGLITYSLMGFWVANLPSMRVVDTVTLVVNSVVGLMVIQA